MSDENILRLIYAIGLLILIGPGFLAYQRRKSPNDILFQAGIWVAIGLVAAFIYSFF